PRGVATAAPTAVPAAELLRLVVGPAGVPRGRATDLPGAHRPPGAAHARLQGHTFFVAVVAARERDARARAAVRAVRRGVGGPPQSAAGHGGRRPAARGHRACGA